MKHQPLGSIIRSSFVPLMAAASVLLPSPAQADPVAWDRTSGSNDYNTGANWVGGAIPSDSDEASFPSSANGTQTVTFSASPATQPGSLTVGTTSGILTFESIRSAAGATLFQAETTAVLGTGSGANIVIKKSGTSDFTFRSQGAFSVGGTGGSNNTVTVTGSGVAAGSTNSLIVVGVDNSSNNLLHVTNGAALSSRGGTIGRTNNSDNNTVKLSGVGTSWTLLGTTTQSLTLGVNAASDNNHLIVENGAQINSTVELRVNRGTVSLDDGGIDLTYDSGGATTDQAVRMLATGRLEGQGSLKASELTSSGNGAIVQVGTGTGGIGTLEAEFTGAGWINSDVKIQMTLGDLTGSPVAGIDYDFLDIAGAFTFGGNLEIDLAAAELPDNFDVLLIGWTGSVGSNGDLSVSFINGSPIDYYYATDGLHLIPEPSTFALVVLGLAGAVLLKRAPAGKQSDTVVRSRPANRSRLLEA